MRTAVSSPAYLPARLRSLLVAGVALAGTALIAVDPVAPTVSGLKERAVQLTTAAATDPITEWVNVFEGASTNLSQIAAEITADPSPVLSQIVANQEAFANTLDTNFQTIATAAESFLSTGLPQAAQAFVTSIEAGDVTDAVNNFNSAVLLGLLPTASPLQQILAIPGEMSQNLTDAIDTLPNIGLQTLLSPVGVLFGTTQAMADSVQSAINAFDAGDTTTALQDLVNLPAVVTGALLNGYATADGVDYVGLLSSASSPSGGGVLDTLLVQIPQEIAQAIGASAPGSAAASLADIGNLFDASAFGDAGANLSTLFADLMTSI